MDLDKIELEKKLVQSLTPDQQILYIARKIGFKTLPPTIDEFCESDQFIGHQIKIYPYWREKLRELYPNPIFNSHQIVQVGGAIGCVSGATKIKLANGESRTIKSLYEEFPLGGFEVFSKNVDESGHGSNEQVIGKCSGVYMTGIKKVVRVQFRSFSVDCTLDHKFLTNHGYIEAQDLQSGDLVEGNPQQIVRSVEFLGIDIPVYDLTVDNYHNYSIDGDGVLIFTHNTGKTTFSQICTLYNLCKFLWIDPEPLFRFLNLSQSISPITIRCLNVSIAKSMDTVVNKLYNLIHNSPWFEERCRSNRGKLPYDIKILPAKKSVDIISEVLFCVICSEINDFSPPEKGLDVLAACLSRMNSRMKNGLSIFCNVFIDSSDKSEDSTANVFLRTSGYSQETMQINASIWEVKPDQYSKETFRVYTGDSGRSPFILPDGTLDSELALGLDKDRIINVPIDLKPLYQSDIIKSIQETAGISTNVDSKFFQDKVKLEQAFCLPKRTDEILKVDFYDSQSLWDLVGEQVLAAIPKGKKLFCRCDLGLSKDLCGISLGCGKEAAWETYGNKKVLVGTYEIPIAFSLGRYDGQETSIDKIIRFFLKLSEIYDIGCISTDQFQSRVILQFLESSKIPHKLLSVDREDTAYVTAKNLIMAGRVDICNNRLLLTEMMNLMRVSPKKIDHPATMVYVPTKDEDLLFIEDKRMHSEKFCVGSKDCSDAVVGCIKTMVDAGEDAFSSVKEQKRNDIIKLYESLSQYQQAKMMSARYSIGY